MPDSQTHPRHSGRGFARSLAMQDALRGLEAAVDGSGGVLLCGEPGSGRDLFARAIHHGRHRRSDEPAAGSGVTLPAEPGLAAGVSMEALLRRAMRELPNGRPFVVVDCGQRDVIEERLFGAAAPPGETSSLERIGEGSAVHAALGGTLVLRLLPEMPARLQLRLARILRDGEVVVGTAAGGWRVEQVAFRPIATSESADGDGLVPELCRRMSQHVLVVPPLRARREDIPGLVRLLLVDVCAAAGTAPKTASSQAVDLLIALPWRGNLGELETLLRRLVRTVPGRHVRLADVLAHVRLDGQLGAAPYHGTLREARAQFEREYVAAVLDQHRGRMSDAARALGLQRTNLYRKVRQLAVRRGSLARHVS